MTFALSSDASSIVVGFGTEKTSSVMYLYHPKLECGSVASTWTSGTHNATVTAGNTTNVSVYNKKLGNISVQKSTNTGTDLAGWVFNVYNSSNTLVGTITTDSNGIATLERLTPGTYTVVEVGGPSGAWGTNDWAFDISSSSSDIVVGNGMNLLLNTTFGSSDMWYGVSNPTLSAATWDNKACLKVDSSNATDTNAWATQTAKTSISTDLPDSA